MNFRGGQVILSPLDMTAAWVSDDAESVTFLCPPAMQGTSIPTASYLARYPTSTIVQSSNTDDALARLRFASEYSMALDLALLLFDAAVSLDTRTEIAVELDEMLTSRNCENYVLDILLAAPLHRSADRDGAIGAAAGRVRVPEFVRVICESQERVRAVWFAWQGQKAKFAPLNVDYQEFTGTLIYAGVFRRLATEVTSQIQLKSFQKQLLSDSALTGRIDSRILKSFLSAVGDDLPCGERQRNLYWQAVERKLQEARWRVARFGRGMSGQLADFGQHLFSLQLEIRDRIPFFVTFFSIITVCLAIFCFATASPWSATLFLFTSACNYVLWFYCWSFGSQITVEQRFSDLSHRWGVPVLGSVPFLTSEELSSRTLDGGFAATAVNLYHPRSATAEAFRAIRTAVSFGMARHDQRVLCVTSAVRRVGKSTLSANLAIAFAQSGRRVLLMDADLRRPSIHQLCGLDNRIGVAEVLAGSATLPDAIQSSDQVPNLNVLTCGVRPTDPAELLSGVRFSELLNSLRSEFDVVIVDTPPIMATPDPLIVACQSDSVLLCVRHCHSHIQQAEKALSRLRDVGAHVLGLVENGVRQPVWADPSLVPVSFGHAYGYGYPRQDSDGRTVQDASHDTHRSEGYEIEQPGAPANSPSPSPAPPPPSRAHRDWH